MTIDRLLLLLVLVVVSIDLFVDLRSRLPRHHRSELRDDAARAVAMAAGGKGTDEDKVRAAAVFLLDLHPKLKPNTARSLVLWAKAQAEG